MHRCHLIVAFLGVVVLAPALADADPEVLPAGPSCNPAAVARADLLPQVPLELVLDREAAAEYEDDGLVVLNNRGYGYRPGTSVTPQPDTPSTD